MWFKSGSNAHPDHKRQELMRTLGVRIHSLRACSGCASVFPFFKCSFCTLSKHVRIWSVQWAYASGTDAHPDHMHQEQMRKLSIRIRNWSVYWAFALWTNACIKCMYEIWKAPSKHAEHTHQELMCSYPYAYHKRKSSIFEKVPNSKHTEQSRCARNWCVHRAYPSGTDEYSKHAHQKLYDA